MPLFYFDVFADDVTIDGVGTELGSAAEAFAHAGKLACDLAATTVREGYMTLHHHIAIWNHARDPIGTLRLGDVVEVRL